MDVDLEQVAYAFEGPVCAVEPPREVVYRALLVFRHGAEDPVPALEAALAGLASGLRVRTRRVPLRGTTVSAEHRQFSLKAVVRRGEVEVRSAHRLQPAALRRLVEALCRVPGAEGLELHGEVPRYSKALSNLRACSPCQARRL